MYATLYDFLRMTPADQAKVTHLDLSIVDEQDFYRAPQVPVANGLGVGSPWHNNAEEYPGEQRETYPERSK